MSETITCGIDAGLETIKTVLLQNGDMIYASVLPIEANTVADIAEKAIDQAISESGITLDQIAGTSATGVGASDLPGNNEKLPEALCLATGMAKINPTFEGVVVDMGAHKSIAVYCRDGMPIKATYSDRCASGSGMFLAMAAQLLEIEIAEIGTLALASTEKFSMQSTCAIYAETEIISLLHNGKRPEDILMSVCTVVAARIFPLLANSGFMPGKTQVALAGGVAHNIGLLKALEERIADKVWIPENPDILCALGAALLGNKDV